ncbi:hypothetical protein [Lentzea pudingi]|nr:hypothetical protein [Lentzea pudingi]
MSEFAVQAPVVVPVDVFDGGDLDVVDAAELLGDPQPSTSRRAAASSP